MTAETACSEGANESYEVASDKIDINGKDKVPMVLCMAHSIQKQASSRPLLVLLDSGASSSWFHRSALPKGAVPSKTDVLSSVTLAGNLQSSQKVNLERVSFPEFFKTRFIDSIECRVFDTPCRYAAIIGRDMLRELGFRLDFQKNKMIWDDCHVAMRPYPTPSLDKKEPAPAELLFLEMLEADLEDDDTAPTADMTDCSEDDYFLNDQTDMDCDQGNDHAFDLDDMNAEEPDGIGYKSKHIKYSKYEGADATDVARSCTHLSQIQQNDLREVLEKYPKLFSKELGVFPYEKIHLDIDPTVPASQSRAYAVPHRHMSVFKAELDRLVKEGILAPQGRSEWISGTFIVPKKDGRVRWVSDFRALNKAIKRKVYPIPRIADILARRTGYKFLSKLDISMQYYTFELDEASQDLCTIATPFGLYKYLRLPMGVSQSPDIAQEHMERLLKGIEDLEVYIDDIACFSKDWKSHLEVLDKVLGILEKAGFSVNPLKCEWGVQETDFLGHYLTPDGVC